MGTVNIKRGYRDGMFWIRINDGDEFAVRPNVWNDAEQRESIIAAETKPAPVGAPPYSPHVKLMC